MIYFYWTWTKYIVTQKSCVIYHIHYVAIFHLFYFLSCLLSNFLMSLFSLLLGLFLLSFLPFFSYLSVSFRLGEQWIQNGLLSCWFDLFLVLDDKLSSLLLGSDVLLNEVFILFVFVKELKSYHHVFSGLILHILILGYPMDHLILDLLQLLINFLRLLEWNYWSLFLG